MTSRLLHEIAHLAHVELLTPAPAESLRFFTEVLGLTEVGRDGGSVYLRTWDDYEHHTVKLTASDTSGIRRTGLRAASQEALDRRVAAIEQAGLGIGWKDADPGIGPIYLCRDPDGHEMELYWETEWYRAPPELSPSLKNQAQAYPGRGVCVRRLDHVNYLAASVVPNGDFVSDLLGGRVTEQIQLDDGTISAQWLHFASKGYDLVYTRDWTGSTGRLHHIAFATDTREDILRAADICLDRGVFIETGPHKHAVQQTFFLYVYEPGGNRIELCNPAARLVLAPDWRTITWTEAERARGQAWGLRTIESFHTHGTPPVLHLTRDVQQDEPGRDEPVTPPQASLRGDGCCRGARPWRGRGVGGARTGRHVRLGQRVRQRDDSEFHGRSDPARLRFPGQVPLPRRVPV